MRQKWMAKVLSGVIATAALLGGIQPAEAKSKEIRVALFVDAGTGYRGVVPSVTLSANQGMEVTLIRGGKQEKLPDIKEEAARFRLDEYYLLAAETTDWNRAQQVVQQLRQHGCEGSIQAVARDGHTMYQVISGSYGSYQAVAGQVSKVAAATGQQPAVKGPFRLEAGTFRSLKDAQEEAEEFADAGIPAYPVVIFDGNRLEYAVWLGDEISRESLRALESTVSAKFSRKSLREADSEAYVVLKQDAGNSAKETIPKYVFSSRVKLVMEPKGRRGALIKVNEREGRSYRGKMEVSAYNGYLTLVNELPLEEYLYGVVGSEMAPGWPLEALKAQAVLARTRAVSFANKYGVADVSDTVYEQAYYGYEKESADVREAVDETEGEILTYQGKPVEVLYYSNAGGMTADGTEAWGNEVPYLRPVESDDEGPLQTAMKWYQVSLADGRIGYVRSDLVTETGYTNPAGLRRAVISTDNTNLRNGPSTTYHKVLATLPLGTALTIISEEAEENAYSWTRGPYTAAEVASMINASQARNNAPGVGAAVYSLRVTERGPSGRVLEMKANGQTIAVSSPDAHRSVFQQGGSSLRSTKFDVEEMGSITILGANGNYAVRDAGTRDVKALSANGLAPASPNGPNDQFLVYGADGEWRTVSKDPMFLIRGTGYGHGLGLSQYGARAMAEKGYDYREILKHYYQGVKIER